MTEQRREDDKEVAELRREFNEFRTKIEPVIEVWESLTGLVKILKWVGLIAKWIAAVAAGFAAWSFFTHKGG